MSDLADDLEDRMNLAAEAAVPEAQSLFLEAIDAMTLDDAQAILTGPKDSATRYFQRQMRDPLSERMAPIVDNALAEAGAVQAYDALVNQYRQLPLVGEVRTNLTGYVLNEALDGLFYYVAEQEAAIRTNPAARTTQILKDVFG
jgi:hypothetical protein